MGQTTSDLRSTGRVLLFRHVLFLFLCVLPHDGRRSRAVPSQGTTAKASRGAAQGAGAMSCSMGASSSRMSPCYAMPFSPSVWGSTEWKTCQRGPATEEVTSTNPSSSLTTPPLLAWTTNRTPPPPRPPSSCREAWAAPRGSDLPVHAVSMPIRDLPHHVQGAACQASSPSDPGRYRVGEGSRAKYVLTCTTRHVHPSRPGRLLDHSTPPAPRACSEPWSVP